MFEKEAEACWNKRWQSKDSDIIKFERQKYMPYDNYIDGFIDAVNLTTKEIYSKAIDDISEKVKWSGFISTEEGFCILRQFLDKEIDEEEFWEKIENMAKFEFSSTIDTLRQSIMGE